jgi:transcriptional regulator with XRE-family HTH domain
VLYLESGQRAPRLDTVEKIACALELSPAYLAFGLEGECQPGESLHCSGVGVRLQTARLACGLNVRDLGRESKTSHTTVRLTENGETVPSIATVEALAMALNVSPAWLAYGVGPQELARRRLSRESATRSTDA